MVQLICLFTAEETLDHTVSMIVKTYEVVYDRIFVLSIEESKELVCSFNVGKGNGLYMKKQLRILESNLKEFKKLTSKGFGK